VTVATEEDEEVWQKLVRGGTQGEDLEEMVDLVRAIEPAIGSACYERFIAKQPTGQGLAERIRGGVAAKRSVRLITALCTTHTLYPRYWRQLLDQVSTMLQQAAGAVDRYKALPQSDLPALRHSTKLQTLAIASARVAEVGLWVAATCLEVACADKALAVTAGKVAHQCTLYAVKALSTWPLPADTPFALPTLASLAALAEDHAAVAQARPAASVVTCNLTLRPLATAVRSDPPTPVLDSVAWKERVNRPYLQGAINIWLNDISEMPPVSDCKF
jgi:hypothetical protein